MKKRLCSLLLLVVPILVHVGCTDDPTTTPGGEPLIFEGFLTDGERIEENLLLEEEGTIRITLTETEPVFIQLPPDDSDPFYTVGVGIGNNSTGECNITFGQSLAEGQGTTVLLQDTARCLLIFDDGTLPPDAKVTYVVTVEDSKG